MENKIRNCILNGATFCDIYHSLGVTKTMINNVFKNIDRRIRFCCGWDSPRTELEKALFSLHRKYTYSKGVNVFNSSFTFDYVLFENNVPKLAILYLGPDYITNNGKPICDEDIYNRNILLLNEKVKFCETQNLPFLIFPILEIFDNVFLASDIRKALVDYDYTKKHNKEVGKEYLDICSICVCDFDNKKDVYASSVCGCYNCGTIIKSKDIKDFSQDDGAICPYCRQVSIITESQGFNINEEFIKMVQKLYDEDN